MDRRNVFPTVISLLAQIVSLRESNIFNRLKTWKEAASSTASHCIRPVFFAHIGNVLLFMVTNLRWYVFLFSNSASVLFLISAFHDAWFIHVVQVQVSIAIFAFDFGSISPMPVPRLLPIDDITDQYLPSKQAKWALATSCILPMIWRRGRAVKLQMMWKL
jgi:hypothetical protein